jgi:hypothetical protein
MLLTPRLNHDEARTPVPPVPAPVAHGHGSEICAAHQTRATGNQDKPERVRAPRLMLAGAERKAALESLKAALATRPAVKIARNASCRRSDSPLPLKILFAELKLHKLARRHFETVAEAGSEILTGIESIREAYLGDGTSC